MKLLRPIQSTAGLSLAGAALLLAPAAFAADVAVTNAPGLTLVAPVLLPFVVEKRGPLRAPKAIKPEANLQVSGQGFWKFAAARDVMPVPFIPFSQLTNAHGTLIIDPKTEIVYWGLQRVGWIGFSNKLRSSWLVQGDPVFAKGNLHGADILPRKGKPALVAATDNVSGQVYLTDTTFQHAEILDHPAAGPYATNHSFRPTDVAFVNEKEMWVVDGYARQRFIPVDVSPLRYRGKFPGGKIFSQTLHGVTYDSHDHSLLLACRPEEQLRRYDLKRGEVTEIMALPPGSTICDSIVWDDYAIVPCLDGPNKSAGVIYIINLKKRAIVSTIKPKDELGYADAQHIHDATLYVTGNGRKQEIYLVFTNWNPGSIGALKLVNIAD